MKLSVIFTLLTLFSSTLFGQREIIDRVVANVGSEIVLLSEVEEQYALLEAQEGVLPDNIRCGIVDQVLAQKLLVNQAKLDSIEVKDTEVEDQLDARVENILAYMNGDTKQFEDYYGQTIAEVKESFRSDLRNQILADRMRGSIVQTIVITPKEVKEFFARIPKDSLPYFNSEVEIAELVYKPQLNEEEKAKAIAELTDLKEQVEAGADFADLASEHSDDFASARIGGDLGWTKRGKFVAAFEAEAYKLDPGEISPIFQSQFGFHILQLMGRRGNTINTRHILIRPEITDADLDLARAKLDTVRQLILTDSISFETAVRKYSDKDLQSYSNAGRLTNQQTGNTFFEIADLDPSIYFTIDTMDINGTSEPFSFASQMGETMFRLVQLQSRSEPHKADLSTDYSKIRAAAKEEKQSRFISDWVEQKIGSTFINLTGAYGSCPNLVKWREDSVKP
ncbi:MAG: peptidyl-prolyl cis-trans isomerase SurA [Paraglaciecola sp.]|jgi:peptidyl-prolyl cis-trans isomerase SurA